MRDAKDKTAEALRILRKHYAGSGKPRITILYSQLTTMKKNHSESITDYITRAENATTALTAAEVAVSDLLLVVMVLKGLPDKNTPFVAVITQQEKSTIFKNSNRLYEILRKLTKLGLIKETKYLKIQL